MTLKFPCFGKTFIHLPCKLPSLLQFMIGNYKHKEFSEELFLLLLTTSSIYGFPTNFLPNSTNSYVLRPQSSISCGLLPEIQILTLSRWQNTPHLLWPCISSLHIFFLFLYVFRPSNLQGVLITGFVLRVSQRACPCGPCKKWRICHFQNLTVFLPQVPRPWRRLPLWWSSTFSFLFPEGSSSCYFWVTWHPLSCTWETDYRRRENLEYWQPTHARCYQVKKMCSPKLWILICKPG